MRFSSPLHIFQIDAFLRHFVQRRKLPQPLDGLNHAIRHIIDFGFSIESSNAKPNRAVRQIVARRPEPSIRSWLKRRRGACRSAGNRNIVDPHQQRLAFDIREADIQIARQSVLHVAVDVHLVEPVMIGRAGDCAAQPYADSFAISACAISQAFPSPTIPERSACPIACRARARRRRSRRNLYPRILAPHIQRAHALRPIHLVGRDRGQIDVVLDHIERYLARRLRRVGVEHHSTLVTELADLRHRLQHPDFVVRVHDRDQNRLVLMASLQTRRDRSARLSAPEDTSHGNHVSPGACRCPARTCAP